MLIVQKYGGTSVGSLERIGAVADHVAATVRAGHRVVIVVSAMSGETDRLLKLADALAPRDSTTASDRAVDCVAATGEQVTVGLLALALQTRGLAAISLLAHQLPIHTDGVFGRARILHINTDIVTRELEAGNVVVLPGFQGVDETGALTTLGRGGSDTSAVAIAAALKADTCEIYTDVDGIYTTDPNIVPHARKLARMEYEELLEMAGAGAKVLQMRSVQMAARFALPLQLRSTFNTSDPGTCIVPEDPRIEATLVNAITYTMNEAKVAVRRIPNRIGLAARIFEPLARANINVDMIVQTVNEQGEAELGFTVAKEDLKKAMQLADAAARDIGARTVEAAGDVSKISIIGLGMRSHAGVAATMFDVLAREGIDIQLISTSEIKVSAVIDMAHMRRAVGALHAAFGLAEPPSATP